MANNLVLDRSAKAIQPLEDNPALVYLAGLARDGRRVQLSALRTIAAILGYADPLDVPWHELRYIHTQMIREKLLERGLAVATVNRSLAALRGVLLAARRLGQISPDDYTTATEVKPARGETLPAGRALSAGEIAALMQSCENDPTPAGARDAAILATMYPGGLRRAEVCGLDIADYTPETGALIVRRGKGRKDRSVYLTDTGAKRALADWLAVRGDEPGPLFLGIHKGGRILPGRLSSQAVFVALRKRAALAGVGDVSPHDLRRTMITDLLDRGADISTVAGLAGHARVTTTQRYDRRPEATKAKAAGLLHLPYKGRGRSCE